MSSEENADDIFFGGYGLFSKEKGSFFYERAYAVNSVSEKLIILFIIFAVLNVSVYASESYQMMVDEEVFLIRGN